MFYEGQKVRCLQDYEPGRQFTKGKVYVVTHSYNAWCDICFERDDKGSRTNGWAARYFEPVRTPTFSDDLRLKPQAKKVLRHLRKHGHISPAKALCVWGISRLAACIYDLRKIGYHIPMKLLRDETGHRYSLYSLAKGA